MSTFVEKMKEKLASQEQSKNKKVSKTKDYIWKPSGKHTIRAIPLKDSPDDPFLELQFVYGLHGPKGKYYLSPATFGHPCPCQEFVKNGKDAANLRKDKESWIAMNNFQRKIGPSLRTFIPVLVRDSGDESTKVKFWGFGKTVKDQLLALFANDDNLDFINLKTGIDLIVEHTPNDDYKLTTTNVHPPLLIKQTPALPNLSDEELEKLVTNQISISELWQEASYAELEKALKEYLEKENDNDSSPKEPDSIPASAEVTPATATESVIGEKSNKDQKEMENEFANVFENS